MNRAANFGIQKCAPVPHLPRTVIEPPAAAPAIPRFNVLGVSVSAMNLRIATDAILEAARAKRKGYICVTGVHGVTEAQNDDGFRRILYGSFVNTSDGMPLNVRKSL